VRLEGELVVDVARVEVAPLLHPTIVRLGDGEPNLRALVAALLLLGLDEQRRRGEFCFLARLDLGEEGDAGGMSSTAGISRRRSTAT
jgi:hypothetical protein